MNTIRRRPLYAVRIEGGRITRVKALGEHDAVWEAGRRLGLSRGALVHVAAVAPNGALGAWVAAVYQGRP